jgi:hypothetical protein
MALDLTQKPETVSELFAVLEKCWSGLMQEEMLDVSHVTPTGLLLMEFVFE